MALQLTEEQPSGITLSYHRVHAWRVDVYNNKLQVEIASYPTDKQRTSEKESFRVRDETGAFIPSGVYVDGSFLDFDYSGEELTTSAIYELVKTTERFSDAQDV